MSMRPETVEPSLAIVRKISPGCAVVVQADRDVALVARDLELVRDRGPLVREAPAVRLGGLDLGGRELAAQALDGLDASAVRPSSFFLPVDSGWLRLQPSR